jgi:hypothetical protein
MVHTLAGFFDAVNGFFVHNHEFGIDLIDLLCEIACDFLLNERSPKKIVDFLTDFVCWVAAADCSAQEENGNLHLEKLRQFKGHKIHYISMFES